MIARRGRGSAPLSPRLRRAWAIKPLDCPFLDLAWPMAASDGGARYCMIVVDDFLNMGWPLILKDKRAATVTHAFRAFLVATKTLIRIHGRPGVLSTDSGTEFVNEEFQATLVEHAIGRELTSVDGPKLNG